MHKPNIPSCKRKRNKWRGNGRSRVEIRFWVWVSEGRGFGASGFEVVGLSSIVVASHRRWSSVMEVCMQVPDLEMVGRGWKSKEEERVGGGRSGQRSCWSVEVWVCDHREVLADDNEEENGEQRVRWFLKEKSEFWKNICLFKYMFYVVFIFHCKNLNIYKKIKKKN